MPDILQLSIEPIFPHDLMRVADIEATPEYRSIFSSVYDVELTPRDLGEAAVITFASGAGLCKSCADLLAVDRTEDGVLLSIRFLDGYREAYLDAAFKGYAKELERLAQASTPQAFSDGSLYERIYALKAHHPLEYYTTLLSNYAAKGDKDRIALVKEESEKSVFSLAVF